MRAFDSPVLSSGSKCYRGRVWKIARLESRCSRIVSSNEPGTNRAMKRPSNAGAISDHLLQHGEVGMTEPGRWWPTARRRAGRRAGARLRASRRRLEHRLLHLRGIHGAASLMSQFDVFVLASRYEGAPYAPLEAMRAGTPVVLTDVVGNRDVVEPGRSGLLVAPDDAAALATAVSRLLLDPALRRELGDAARGRIAERFDVRRMASSLTGLYREAAADAS
jgi:glycosyltransferase involved in cell wall biosynthesis